MRVAPPIRNRLSEFHLPKNKITYLLGGSVVLLINGVFAVRGWGTQEACLHTIVYSWVYSLLGLDYRISGINLHYFRYYDGCHSWSLSIISLVPSALGAVLFLATTIVESGSLRRVN